MQALVVYNPPIVKIKSVFSTMALTPKISAPNLEKLQEEDIKDQNISASSIPKYLQDGTRGNQTFFSSLPTEKGWLAEDLYQYQGFWHSARHLLGVISCLEKFQAHNTDIILATQPKSGTTWLKALAFSIVYRNLYSPASSTSDTNFDHHPLLSTNPHDLVPFLELKFDIDNNILDLNKSQHPRLFSTHLPYTWLPASVLESKCKVVYLCRGPKDTFISLWQFVNKLRHGTLPPLALEDAFEMFCRGVSLYGPYWDHHLGYWKESLENPERILFLKYEDLKREPLEQLKRLALFLGCPFSVEEEEGGVMDKILRLCSFENLSRLEINKSGKQFNDMPNNAFFRRGEVGDSLNYLTAEMVERLDRITKEKLIESGLKI